MKVSACLVAVSAYPRALALAIVWIGSAAVLAAISWSVLVAGHPAHLVTIGVIALIGVLLAVCAARLRRRTPRAEPWSGLLVIGRALAVVATLAVVGALIYLKPFGASANAVDAMSGVAGVRVDDSATQIVITPTEAAPERGFVFQPGARVDPRAYVPCWSRSAGPASWS